MEHWMLILCVIPTIVTTITISPNGNSPETKMTGGMIGDGLQMNIGRDMKTALDKSKSTAYIKAESPKLAINERYRRLIPYMTFYYANDLVPPPPKHNANNVEVEKAEIVESGTVKPNEREPKVIYTTQRHKNIPRYHGNRLTQFNIASSNPTKVFYKELPVLRQNTLKSSANYNPTIVEHSTFDNRDLVYRRFVPQQIKAPSAPFSAPTKKTFLNNYQNDAFSPNIQYYTSDQEIPKYRLIPYEQTPPVKVVNANAGSVNQYNYNTITSPEPVYTKTRPTHYPQPFTEGQNVQAVPQRKPEPISEVYYEKSPTSTLVEPVLENGFKPIIREPVGPIEVSNPSVTRGELPYKNEEQQGLSVVKSVSVPSEDTTYQPQYVIDRPVLKDTSNSVSLAELLNSLQINKSIPKPITRENVGDSIRTLLQVLNTLKAAPLQNEVEVAVVSTPKPFEPSDLSVATPLPYVPSTTSKSQESDLHEEPYLAPVHTPSQYLDDYPTGGGSTQRFPLPVTSDEEGGTPGRPGIEYPILTVIPPTKFDCKTQRYKGFFADPETRCQVWHYCDLNGGQASFLCPNGTIFSQAALTCDWWFNVRCASTAQLYVLNESLYKYILPHSPKFPEDYSGPLVDKYLSLKFKEMEEQFKKNKNKKVATEKIDTEDSSEASDKQSSIEESVVNDKISESSVNQADVTIETSGNSGNVQRLQDE